MTREEALEILDTIPTISEQVDALEMAIEALEAQSCEDCISRQAVLDINAHHHGQMSNRVNHEIWEEIKALPSVTSTRPTYCPHCGARMVESEAQT